MNSTDLGTTPPYRSPCSAPPGSDESPPSPPPAGCFTCFACNLVNKIDTEISAVRRKMFLPSGDSTVDGTPNSPMCTSDSLSSKPECLTSGELSDPSCDSPSNIQELVRSNGKHSYIDGGLSVSDYFPDDHDVFSPAPAKQSPAIVIEFIDDMKLLHVAGQRLSSEVSQEETKSKSLSDDTSSLDHIDIVVDDVAKIYSEKAVTQSDVVAGKRSRINNEGKNQINQLDNSIKGPEGSMFEETVQQLQDIINDSENVVTLENDEDQQNENVFSTDSDLLRHIINQQHQSISSAENADSGKADVTRAADDQHAEEIIDGTIRGIAAIRSTCTADLCQPQLDESDAESTSSKFLPDPVISSVRETTDVTKKTQKIMQSEEQVKVNELIEQVEVENEENSHSAYNNVLLEQMKVDPSAVVQEMAESMELSNNAIHEGVKCHETEGNPKADSSAQLSIEQAVAIVVCEPMLSYIHGSTEEFHSVSEEKNVSSTQVTTPEVLRDRSGSVDLLAKEALSKIVVKAEQKILSAESHRSNHQISETDIRRSIDTEIASVKQDNPTDPIKIEGDDVPDNSQIVVEIDGGLGAQFLSPGNADAADEIESELISSGPVFTPPEEASCPLLSNETVGANEKCREWVNSTSKCDEICSNGEVNSADGDEDSDQLFNDDYAGDSETTFTKLQERAEKLGITGKSSCDVGDAEKLIDNKGYREADLVESENGEDQIRNPVLNFPMELSNNKIADCCSHVDTPSDSEKDSQALEVINVPDNSPETDHRHNVEQIKPGLVLPMDTLEFSELKLTENDLVSTLSPRECQIAGLGISKSLKRNRSLDDHSISDAGTPEADSGYAASSAPTTPMDLSKTRNREIIRAVFGIEEDVDDVDM